MLLLLLLLLFGIIASHWLGQLRLPRIGNFSTNSSSNTFCFFAGFGNRGNHQLHLSSQKYKWIVVWDAASNLDCRQCSVVLLGIFHSIPFWNEVSIKLCWLKQLFNGNFGSYRLKCMFSGKAFSRLHRSLLLTVEIFEIFMLSMKITTTTAAAALLSNNKWLQFLRLSRYTIDDAIYSTCPPNNCLLHIEYIR